MKKFFLSKMTKIRELEGVISEDKQMIKYLEDQMNNPKTQVGKFLDTIDDDDMLRSFDTVGERTTENFTGDYQSMSHYLQPLNLEADSLYGQPVF